MKPDEFLSSVYLGDRACKAIVLDGWKDEVKIQIDLISRCRSETWNFYSAEDVEDGFLVFEGVDHVSFDPQGPIPNGEIGDIEFVAEGDERFLVKIDIGYAEQKDGNVIFRNPKLTIRAKAAAIEKPGEEGARIRD
ncbi:DUF6258 family protein [Ensifer adhaerens]|uniref:DUF6258 family protein n=1 Tax=Ensifer adhaerens TaxID=106592 RepID=UPI00098F0D16|nr:DUF6258 family protein [Ensifer adhaerens]